jgi:hypothetical protein
MQVRSALLEVFHPRAERLGQAFAGIGCAPARDSGGILKISRDPRIG